MNILTSFPFTFKLSVPGISNPFTSLTTAPSPTSSQRAPTRPVDPSSERPSRSLVRPIRPLPISVGSSSMGVHGPQAVRLSRPSFSPSPSPTPSASVSLAHTYSHLIPKTNYPYIRSHSPSPVPLARKRGWEPAFSSPSASETEFTTNGYLNAPTKYRREGGVETTDRTQDMRELGEDGEFGCSIFHIFGSVLWLFICFLVCSAGIMIGDAI
ncbi:hypothetical protein FA15DRAFT_594622 [Coprinopsis marcescibilis]|uniref:Uncharacterized protein n=1 Tax=Coprinopsis marcescibilis TaxID=230819 RepID=A0A5C3KRL9_COPMA|nr:hypothetical protein FA15DRAFT_594622 [Coprinopsis marcescibilis]